MSEKCLISDIKHFAVHDGDGIRTTVFFKGCTLKCVWCHNPESISFEKSLGFYENKCVGCGLCTDVCQSGARKTAHERLVFDRDACVFCGACVDVCVGGANVLYGRPMSVDEIFDEVMRDKAFYDSSAGGVTLSGGECLCHSDFCMKLLKKLKENGVNTAVDTCGYADRRAVDAVLPYTDTFLYDIKAIDEEVHVRCTGHSNTLILENLRYIDSRGKNIEVRIPYVPGYNSDQTEKIRDFVKELKNVVRVKVLPYHNFAASKYRALGIKDTLPEQVPPKNEIDRAQALFDELF